MIERRSDGPMPVMQVSCSCCGRDTLMLRRILAALLSHESRVTIDQGRAWAIAGASAEYAFPRSLGLTFPPEFNEYVEPTMDLFSPHQLTYNPANFTNSSQIRRYRYSLFPTVTPVVHPHLGLNGR